MESRIKLSASGLHVHSGNVHALKGVTVTIAEHRLTALIGPSGCGKSTLLRTFNRMNDLIPGCRIEGTAELDGQALYGSDLHVETLRQRVGMVFQLCIARAMAIEPKVLLMDEPCSTLDPFATLRIEWLMRDIARRYTILLVTHNMQQAMRISDTTGFLLLGELIEMGPTAELFTRPHDRRTEDFVTGRHG